MKFGKFSLNLPSIGQGTMGIGGYFNKVTSKDNEHIRILKYGIDLGLTFIDTAEAYGAGHTEELISKAISTNRENIFIASKVSPENLKYADLINAANRSLTRLATDYLDLYQIHWPNPAIALDESFKALIKLIEEGKIKYVGVCNFSIRQLKEAYELFGEALISVQSEYNLFDRSVENDLLPFCDENGLIFLAYSPIDKANISYSDSQLAILNEIAFTYSCTIFQLMLRWLMSKNNVIPLVKAEKDKHVKENVVSIELDLSMDELSLIDQTFKLNIINIPVEDIDVADNGLDNYVPGPEVLAKTLIEGDNLKPIRVVRNENGPNEYKLVEGKLRYWAWRTAFGYEKPIPSLKRN